MGEKGEVMRGKENMIDPPDIKPAATDRISKAAEDAYKASSSSLAI
jgi:hypothetical protein